jgi:hypothetical protein
MFYHFRKIVDYVAFRTTKNYTAIKIKSLKPNYWDKDTLMLHAVMQLVVDYVEIELSALQLADKNQDSFKEKLYRYLPWPVRPSNLIRSRERGLKYINYIKSFDGQDDESTPLKEQIEHMKILENVYLWWKDVYPNRIDPDVLSGFNLDYSCDKAIKSIEIEENYYKEESSMLNLIVNIRGSLWT